MKPELIFLSLMLLMLLAVSCRHDQDAGPATKYNTPSGIPTIWKVTIDGHDYLGFDVYEGGGGLCHAESCPCKKL